MLSHNIPLIILNSSIIG